MTRKIDEEAVRVRVEAYEQAAGEGFPRYGRRGGNAGSALQWAAAVLGFDTVGPVLSALRQAQHGDVIAAGKRRAVRATERQLATAKRARISARRNSAAIARDVGNARSTGAHARLEKDRGVSARVAQRRRKERDELKVARDKAAVARIRRGSDDQNTPVEAAIEALERATSGHALALMYRRGQLARPDFLACCSFRASFEVSNAPPVRAIDFTSERVDGGAIAPRRAHGGAYAEREYMKAVCARLGEIGYTFLVMVAVHGTPLVEAARELKIGSETKRRKGGEAAYAAERFREIVSVLRQAMAVYESAA
jgi:hypothetical protein